MNDLSYNISYLWFSIQASPALKIFTISALILIFGVFMQVLKVFQTNKAKAAEAAAQSGEAVKKRFVPDKRALFMTFFAIVAMLMSSVQFLNGRPPFTGPYDSMYIIAVFLIAGSMGILAELRWKNGKDYPFSFLVGTAMAFMFLSVRFTFGAQDAVLQLVGYSIILLASLYLAKKIFFPVWSRGPQVTSIGSFALWSAIYLIAG